MSKIGQYWKFITAAAGAAATILVTLGVHNSTATVIIAVATALGVLAVPNTPKAPAAQAATPVKPAPPAATGNVTITPKAAP